MRRQSFPRRSLLCFWLRGLPFFPFSSLSRKRKEIDAHQFADENVLKRGRWKLRARAPARQTDKKYQQRTSQRSKISNEQHKAFIYQPAHQEYISFFFSKARCTHCNPLFFILDLRNSEVGTRKVFGPWHGLAQQQTRGEGGICSQA
ncbi:uncharacterized protein BO72DRAFT_27675 [Aspergillus fijiensis CBS 313.89]|uniref:Uncharacterized protein n=1 Tax=Aspergillus fijiensis CBS 313.89 TaxID=1448319 RepID=A0A8G1RCD5_9EURO|nr:uncharacterized protein BO72DRAFT_27675 [Aspergillus fijiensis CBS 313.89]RAK71167.1 hypothetical protein BO72DRAFT_27675 [Aspergillus fijiensis CBS 313.89]